MDKSLVSVIVPTYNSSLTLELCLASLRLQTYPNIEIIIVDNYSTDDTVKIARKYGLRVFQVKALRSAARNYGAKKTRGDYLLFLDFDMELTPGVVEECVQKMIKGNTDAIMIPEIRVGEGFWAKCRAIERLTYIGDPLIESARFFRREVFEKVSGYDEDLEAGEDWDLHAQVEDAGYKIKSVSAFVRHHEGRLKLRKIVIKRYYYGKTLMNYIKKHPRRASIQFIPIRLNYIKRWKIFAKKPLYGCGMLMMKMIEYATTAVGMASVIFYNVRKSNQ